jgi:hypothetical protein
MPKAAETRAIEQRRRHGDDSANLVDMRLDMELNDQLLLACGGRWNRRLNDWEGDVDACENAVVARLHPGQLKATQWFAGWIGVHAGRRDNPPGDAELNDEDISTDPFEVYSALVAGGRRGGKTFWAAVAVVAYAVQFPGAIIWCVSPSRGRDDTKADEIRRYMVPLIAPEWIRRQTVATGWELINGSTIMLKSAHIGTDSDAIKEGQADLVWMNESQKMAKRVYVVARGAISDKSGLVLCCANPPVEAKDQQWVSDFAADTDSGRRASVHLPFNPLDNPHIDRRALLAMAAELDERTFQIEVLGMFMPAIDCVAYNWLRKENEIRTPQPTVDGHRQVPCPRTGLVDVTAEFLQGEEEGEGITKLIGLDVQRIPYIGGPVYKFFDEPGRRPTRETVSAWIVGEEILDGGDEEEWCYTLHEAKYDPTKTLIVCDATGEYQHSRRRAADSPPPTWTGRGSFDLIRGAGFRRIVPPSRRFHRKNPEIVDRIRSFTSMICNKLGVRRLFADPDLAPKTCKAIHEWKAINGKPSRSQDVAHLGDGISYPLIRLFPRILRSGNTVPMDPVTERVDRPRADAGDRFFGAPTPAARRPPRNRGL